MKYKQNRGIYEVQWGQREGPRCTEVKSEVIYPLRLNSGVTSSRKLSLLDSLLQAPIPFQNSIQHIGSNFLFACLFLFLKAQTESYSVWCPQCLTCCLSWNSHSGNIFGMKYWRKKKKTMTARLKRGNGFGRYLAGKMYRTWRSLVEGGSALTKQSRMTLGFTFFTDLQ